ncbi:tetratricopeptide repeat protein [Streptomyces roseochromogenus]|uniref:Regulatory protein n=1 Tax=Streptomyces roseochromogenus subsp. oscitans DS 12.976 TaxID=1352936 RepID=V6KXK5_STRRC|nr:tetratricopeptide repeat protein [Streptomyces roseochromogenus]EST33704.1 regulatory protein [Streptomyces roseochromogenus subsp. oscitans DS 12.976]
MSGNSGSGANADKRSNELLGSWFVRSGWSKGELARQVNRRARQLGANHISTDTSRVRRWLDGENPREPIPRILSELFSERFGCVVSIEDLGLRAARQSPSATGVDLPWTGPQTVALLSEFSRSDLMLARRGFLGTSLALCAGPTLIEPMQRWLVPTPASAVPVAPEPVLDPRRPGRLSRPELDLLESTTRMFRQWDAQCGGGLRRKAVVGQLHEVTDLLQEPQPEATTRTLFKVAAELAELAGWMSYDVGLQPTAQKYFVLALHAAKEAGDKPLGSYILSSMSRQMIHLGRPDDALELIHLAQYGSRDCASPRTQSMLYAMEARAYANMGQPGKTKRAVRMAEDTFAEADEWDEPDPDWIRFFSEAELYGENSHSFRDLAYVAGRSPTYASLAEPLMQRAVELFAKDGEHQRSYALNLIGMATVHLLQREPEESTAFATRAMDIAKKVRSERVNTRIRKTVDTAVRDYGDLTVVVDLGDQLAVDLPETAEAV